MNTEETVLKKAKELEGLASAIVLDMLTHDNSFSQDEKSFIWAWLFPQNMLDGDLIKKMQSNQGAPDWVKIGILMEAYKSRQYQKFIKHLVYSFSRPEKVFRVSGNVTSECVICGKVLQESAGEAYGSSESTLILELPCIILLNRMAQYLEYMEPGSLWGKNTLGTTTNT